MGHERRLWADCGTARYAAPAIGFIFSSVIEGLEADLWAHPELRYADNLRRAHARQPHLQPADVAALNEFAGWLFPVKEGDGGEAINPKDPTKARLKRLEAKGGSLRGAISGKFHI